MVKSISRDVHNSMVMESFFVVVPIFAMSDMTISNLSPSG